MENIKPLILEHEFLRFDAKFSLDGSVIAGISYDQNGRGGPQPQTCIFWRTEDWQEVNRYKTENFSALALSPNNRDFAVLNTSQIEIRDIRTGNLTQMLGVVDEPLYSWENNIIFSANGQLVAASSEMTGCVYLCDVATSDIVHILNKQDDHYVVNVQFCPDGQWLIGLGYEYDHTDRAYFWDLNNGKLVATFNKHKEADEYELNVAVSASGKYLAGNGRFARLWNTNETAHGFQWKQAAFLHGQKTGAWETSFSPDENTLAVLGSETTDIESQMTFPLMLWDVLTRQERAACALNGKCFCFGFSPDSQILVTMTGEVEFVWDDECSEYILTLWQVSSGRRIESFTISAIKTKYSYHAPFRLNFSSDSRWLAVSYTGHVEIWDIAAILTKSVSLT